MGYKFWLTAAFAVMNCAEEPVVFLSSDSFCIEAVILAVSRAAQPKLRKCFAMSFKA